jgi:hypothetical protein
MSTDPNPEPAEKKTRANSAEVAARVEEVLYARLNGAELYDLVAFAKEKGWDVSKRQLQRYAAAADDLLAESLEKDRQKLLRRHLAQRRSLYARAIADGDLRTALAVAQDEAELEGLYPRKGVELTGANGAPLSGEKLTDEQCTTAIVGILAGYGIVAGAPPGGPAAPGPGGDPADSQREVDAP